MEKFNASNNHVPPFSRGRSKQQARLQKQELEIRYQSILTIYLLCYFPKEFNASPEV